MTLTNHSPLIKQWGSIADPVEVTANSATVSVDWENPELYQAIKVIGLKLKSTLDNYQPLIQVKEAGVVQSASSYSYTNATIALGAYLDAGSDANSVMAFHAFNWGGADAQELTMQEFTIYLPGDTDVHKFFEARISGKDTSGNAMSHFGTGVWEGSTNALSGIEYSFNTGDVEAGGVFLVLGYPK